MNTQQNFFENVKVIAIVITIALLIPVTIQYGAATLAPAPAWPGMTYDADYQAPTVNNNGTQAKALNQQERREIDKQARAKYKKQETLQKERMFCINAISGFVCLFLGLLFKPNFISLGFLFGGTLSIVSSYRMMRPNFINGQGHFLLLLLVLIIVIATSHFKLSKKNNVNT